ncbi:MAG: response regulator [Bacteroidetes bacterium]|nr:response regulator [Bacteroidota bacterium]
MSSPKNQFPFKIIISYLILGALAVVVSYFLYTEYQNYIAEAAKDPETEKIIETGSVINEVYETDSFSRIALLTQKQSDFDTYLQKSDSLYNNIEELKKRIEDSLQKQQLDSVKSLLTKKSENIKQLYLLKLTSEKNTSFDDILREFKKFDLKTGRQEFEDFVREPELLSDRARKVYEDWAEYITETNLKKNRVKSITVDSLVVLSRFIVMDAKRENSAMRRALKEKENELLKTELDISLQLRKMMSDFDSEVTKNRLLENKERQASEARTKNILKIAGASGVLAILVFSYLLITDFFKAEKFKRKLQSEKQYSEEVLKTREQLMATVSHDLKTPLNTIVGYSELFTHTSLSTKQLNYTQQIASSAHFISQMVDDLLDFSKLEAGKLPIDSVPFSLENLLHQIAKASKDLHIEKPISLNLYIDETLEGKVFTSDPLRIQQIIHNLVSNAYKFTEKGRIQITANILKAVEGIYNVEIAVTDSGIGISKEKQQLIFKEFTQAEKDTFKRFGGSGLGLAISKKIAQLLGGTLKVKSELGEGSTFFFTLPLTVTNAIKIVPEKSFHPAPISSSIKAVIIDDDPSMIQLLKELFEQMDIKAQGFTRFQDFKNEDDLVFDFVLTDIEMPEHNGFAVLKSLQDGEIINYHSQPVLAMTGAKKHLKEEYLSHGFTDMLQKPFSKNQLIAALSPLFLTNIETHLPEIEVFKNSTHALYDLAFLESFLSNEDSINEVLTIFYEQTEEDMALIKSSITNFDCDLLQSTAHKMLTMCRQLSAERVLPILETMEHCARNNTSKSEIESLFATLSVEVKDLIAALQNRAKITV